MCNFHEAVAVRAAADPRTGDIHAGYHAVIRVALSRYWAQRYVDGAENVDGYNFYALATHKQQASFKKSGLKKDPAIVEAEELAGMDFLRGRLQAMEGEYDFSPEGLGLPVITARPAFIDMAIDHFYKGDPKGKFDIVEEVGRDDLKPLHRAVSALHADPETRSVLEALVKGKISSLYTEAPRKANQKIIAAYEAMPETVKAAGAKVSQYGGNLVLGGFSGLIGHGIHYASILGAGIATGTASSLNLALSGAFMLASYGGWHQFFGGRYQDAKQQVGAFAAQAGLAAVVAFGAQSFLPHDHIHSERMEWFASLPEEARRDFMAGEMAKYNRLSDELRLKIGEAAKAEGLTPAVYMMVCDGTDPLSAEINEYLHAQNEREKRAPLIKAEVLSPV